MTSSVMVVWRRQMNTTTTPVKIAKRITVRTSEGERGSGKARGRADGATPQDEDPRH